MSVFVATPLPGCPAHYALLTEGVIHEEAICPSDFSYGELWERVWNEFADKRAPFVMVEHDIVPWPGLVTELLDCDEPWCSSPYHIGGQGPPMNGMGIAKVKPVGTAPDSFAATRWQMLDGAVVPTIRERLEPMVHVHFPGVAHARRP